MKTHLGLDISTSCTGWSLVAVDDNQRVLSVKLGYIPLSKLKDPYDKAAAVRDSFNNLANIAKELDSIYIEENLQAFRPGSSSAKTLVKLARFNGVVSYISEQMFFKKPEFLNVNHARKSLGIKIQREKVCGISTKQQVLDWVASLDFMEGYDWPVKTLKSGPRKGQEVVDPVCYDMADALVIALAGSKYDLNIS